LIISPNKVFSDYISNVLPELGEDHIPETGMEDLADELLDYKYEFQSFFQQMSLLLEKPDRDFLERIRFKSSYEFLSNLNKHLLYVENKYFQAASLKVGIKIIPVDYIEGRFKKYTQVPIFGRIPLIVKDVQDYARTLVGRKLNGNEKTMIWQAVPRMFKLTQPWDVYRDFYHWIGRKELFVSHPGGKLEYADVFPFLYYRIRLAGIENMQAYNQVKHLIVDEMQDYTPVQYAVLSRIFRCKKTILGDVSQTVNPYSASSAETIERIFPQADVVKLFRSYRSTWEITAFNQRIFTNPNIIPMERHGDDPAMKGFTTVQEEMAGIKRLVEQFRTSGHQSLGIIVKTPKDSEAMFRELKSLGAHLLTPDNTSFRGSVIITTVHLAKGLEFDEVIVCGVAASNYHSEVERSLLYIACTRAMHRLTVVWTGEKSSLLPAA
jgi:DNA helicase-2/ATP-dependent DNA helicase PcrA